MPERLFTVEGMSCGGCESNVIEAVSSVDGVHGVSADHADDRVSVESDGSVDESDVVSAIEAAGYQVVG